MIVRFTLKAGDLRSYEAESQYTSSHGQYLRQSIHIHAETGPGYA